MNIIENHYQASSLRSESKIEWIIIQLNELEIDLSSITYSDKIFDAKS